MAGLRAIVTRVKGTANAAPVNSVNPANLDPTPIPETSKPRQGRGLRAIPCLLTGLYCGDVNRRWAFLTLLHVEADFLTFIKRFVTIASDSGVVNENVLAAIFRRDKAETLRRVEPLNCTSTQDNTLYIKNNKMDRSSENRQFEATNTFSPDPSLTITFHVNTL